MIKLFKKLAEHNVEFYVLRVHWNQNLVMVQFQKGMHIVQKLIDLSEFTNVWGGNHVLENVLETYLDEFLGERSERAARRVKSNV